MRQSIFQRYVGSCVRILENEIVANNIMYWSRPLNVIIGGVVIYKQCRERSSKRLGGAGTLKQRMLRDRLVWELCEAIALETG